MKIQKKFGSPNNEIQNKFAYQERFKKNELAVMRYKILEGNKPNIRFNVRKPNLMGTPPGRRKSWKRWEKRMLRSLLNLK